MHNLVKEMRVKSIQFTKMDVDNLPEMTTEGKLAKLDKTSIQIQRSNEANITIVLLPTQNGSIQQNDSQLANTNVKVPSQTIDYSMTG